MRIEAHFNPISPGLYEKLLAPKHPQLVKTKSPDHFLFQLDLYQGAYRVKYTYQLGRQRRQFDPKMNLDDLWSQEMLAREILFPGRKIFRDPATIFGTYTHTK